MTSQTPTAQTPTAPGGVVERSFLLLQAVVADGGPVGVRELARRTGLARSTVSRLLTTLANLGMVDRDADGLVRPGTALSTLSADEASSPLLRDQLRPLLTELVEISGESAAVSIDAITSVHYIGGALSNHRVRALDVTGDDQDFHIVAPGLVLMAFWEPGRLDRHLAGEPLSKRTEFTVTDPGELRSRLADIRSVGHVWTNQEHDLEVNGLAVPVWRDGQVVAAVSVYGPAHRLSPALRPALAGELMDVVAARVPTLIT